MEDRKRPSGVLMVLFFGVLMAALDIAIVAPALPALKDEFGIDERSISWVINAFVVFNLVGLTFMTRMSDQLGRRVVYIADLLLFAAGSAIVAMSDSFSVMIVGRCIQGLAASGIFPVASAVVGDVYPPERRGRALGLLGAVFGLAFLIGPILGGILLQYGWQLLFVINIPIAIIVAVVAYRVLPEEEPQVREKFDIAGMVLLGSLLASLAFGLNRIDTQNFWRSVLSIDVLPFLIAGIAFLAVFIAAERRAANPLIRLGLFANRQVRLAALFAMGAGLTEAAFLFMSGFAIAALDVTKSEASFMLLPLVLGVMLGSPLAGRLLDRLGSRVIVFAGAVLATAGMATLGMTATTTGTYYTGSVLIGLGLSCILGSSIAYILLNEAELKERTVAQGISTIFISLGQLVGSALIGAVVASNYSTADGYQSAFSILAVVGLLLVGFSMLLKNRQQEIATSARSSV